MKKLVYTSLVVIGLVLMACPYEGKVELNNYEESLKLDKKLIDEWVSFNEEGGREELVIIKIDKAVFQVSHKQFSKGSKLDSRDVYRAYATDIGGINIFNIETKDNKYLYCKYGWTGKNEFYIQFIKQEYMEANFKEDPVSTENLRAFITEHVNKEELFDAKLEFYRKFSPEYDKVKIYMKKSGF